MEAAHLVKCLLWQLSLTVRTHVKTLGMLACRCHPSTGDINRKAYGWAHWPASLTGELMHGGAGNMGYNLVVAPLPNVFEAPSSIPNIKGVTH